MNVIDLSYKTLIDSVDFKKNDVLVGAISGGPDSMCLLNLLLRLKNEYKVKVICAHVNHKVRKESDSEYLFVQKYCLDNGVIFEGMEINNKIKGNFESGARKIRYDFFRKIMDKYNSHYLFTAHHGDDLMETILMRIVRGSNINGYYGFSYKSKFYNGLLIRPLIQVTKKDIVDYNSKNNIPWAEDYTNKDDSHTRNRYRKYILPKLKEENLNVNLKFLQYSEDIEDASEYIDNQTQKMINEIYKDNKIDINVFKKYEHIIQMNALYLILNQIYKDDICLINRKHVKSIYDLIYSDNANKYIKLPNNYCAFKDYDNVSIFKNIDNKGYNYIFDGNRQLLPNGKTIEKLNNSDMTNNFICYLSSKDLTLPLIIRTKNDGDIVSVKNLNGHIKLKKIFIDSKINVEERKKWPIVTDSKNNILWVPGLKKTKYDKQNEQNYDIILRYY